MNCAYRLIWNERINAWSVVPEIAKARGKGGAAKRSAAVLLLTLACASHAVMAADLAATALPGGAQVAAGQATVSSSTSHDLATAVGLSIGTPGSIAAMRCREVVDSPETATIW